MLTRLAGACALALVLAAAQVLPTLEFASASRRGAGMGATEIYQFGLEPVRAIELVCPNVFGMRVPMNRSWIGMVPPAGDHNYWVPSLYIGILALVLALGTIRWRSAPPWLAWMTIIAVLGLAASFGKHGGPLWWARWGPFASILGPHDPIHGVARSDSFLGDGIGSVYAFFVVLLPGFGAFRYPSKVLTFFTVATAVLAGAGWDRAAAGETRWLRRFAQAGLGTTLVGFAIATAVRGRAIAWITGRVPSDTTFGPADIAWERKTLRPLAGLPLGLEYCETVGNMELDDYFAFFAVQPDMPVPAPMARILGVPPDHPIYYFPRRSFDLWGARYFICPAYPGWQTPERGFASFLFKTDLLYPDRAATALGGGEGSAGEPWAVRHDWQLRRNREVYPRAWIVHSARVRPLATRPEVRDRLTEGLIFMNDPIWNEPDRPVYNLRESALIETDDREALKTFLPGTPVGPTERVAVIKYEPQRVELKASTDRPGLVILADTYYPGWHLTIDGQIAPFYRAYRLMRGAAVPAGVHTLVYTYDPASFRVGVIACVAAVIVLLVLAGSCWRRPVIFQSQ
jgi:hypothetical protein